LLTDGLLVPHSEQRIDAPRANQVTERSYITQRRLPTTRLRNDDGNRGGLSATLQYRAN
jgi:hypothetical protein